MWPRLLVVVACLHGQQMFVASESDKLCLIHASNGSPFPPSKDQSQSRMSFDSLVIIKVLKWMEIMSFVLSCMYCCH